MWEPVIGLEIHIQLQTKSKLFCSCKNSYGDPPNTNICPVCLGHPGTLPVLNWEAVKMATKLALALNCRINPISYFARKNYFYPDLPKGYQITQHKYPLAQDGYIELRSGKRIRIERLHLEEDSGKSIHTEEGTLVDFNRCGVPLAEIVTKPDISSPEEAVEFLKILRLVAIYTGVSDADMEKGNMRCDANLSLKPAGADSLGVKTEVKNLNSFRFLAKALQYEIERQKGILEKGGRISQETRGYDSHRGITFTMRSKEEAHDYRYFPEPDLPPLVLSQEFIGEIKEGIAELPWEKKRRFVEEFGLDEETAWVLCGEKEMAELFEETLKHFPKPKELANWVKTEVMKLWKEGMTITPPHLGELLKMVDEGEISRLKAKEVLEEVAKTGKSPKEIVEEKGLAQISDEASLRVIIEEVVREFPDKVEKYRSGKKGLLGFFMGQVMRRTQGKANPKIVNKILGEVLNGK